MKIEDILDRLRAVRIEMGFSREDMDEALGLKSGEYGKKEDGEDPITTEQWLKIAETLGQPLERFFTKSRYDKETLMLINGYRRLTEKGKRTVMAVLNALLLTQWSEFKTRAKLMSNNRKQQSRLYDERVV